MDDLLREALGILFSSEIHTCTVPLDDAGLDDVVADSLIQWHTIERVNALAAAAKRGDFNSTYISWFLQKRFELSASKGPTLDHSPPREYCMTAAVAFIPPVIASLLPHTREKVWPRFDCTVRKASPLSALVH